MKIDVNARNKEEAIRKMVEEFEKDSPEGYKRDIAVVDRLSKEIAKYLDKINPKPSHLYIVLFQIIKMLEKHFEECKIIGENFRVFDENLDKIFENEDEK